MMMWHDLVMLANPGCKGCRFGRLMPNKVTKFIAPTWPGKSFPKSFVKNIMEWFSFDAMILILGGQIRQRLPILSFTYPLT
jgi:hypothetical protein